MKLVLTLLTRDQADVVDAVVRFHLHAGADFVIAMDHGSVDGTAEILESYERAGVLQLIRLEGDELRTREWRTTMARLAAVEHNADWVIGCDGDEFWWPRGGSLKEVLGAVPRRYGVLSAPWRFFLPRPGASGQFHERMTARLSPRAPLLHPVSRFKPSVKIVHRAHPAVVVQGGNHHLLEGPLDPLPGWHPIEVLHFPVRSLEQLERRQAQWIAAGRKIRYSHGAVSTPRDEFDRLVVDDDELERGLACGALTVDTRLRDALRSIESGLAPAFGLPEPADEIDYAPDRVAFGEGTLVRLTRRCDELRARVARI